MNILALASRFPATFLLFAFIIFLYSSMRKTDERIAKKTQNFWDREREANSTRRKPLDDVDFIQIPYDELPMELESEDERIAGCIHDIELMRDDKIANFTGMTNTDLKLKYGAPNITLLTRYDGNFTHLCRVLHEWCSRLYELGHIDEALRIAEYAVSIHSDVSADFYLCADIYDMKYSLTASNETTGDSGLEATFSDEFANKISWLKSIARTLNSAIMPSLVKSLDDRYPDIT